MLSSNNILQPSFGNPVSIPTQDMVLGLYYLTFHRDEYKGPAKGRRWSTTTARTPNRSAANGTSYVGNGERGSMPDVRRPARRVMPTKRSCIGLQEWIYVRVGTARRIRTTVGRVIFNMRFPEIGTTPFVNHDLDKNALKKLITDCYRKYGNAETAEFLDAIKALGFHYATQSGTTVSISDIVVPQAKYDAPRQSAERSRRTP